MLMKLKIRKNFKNSKNFENSKKFWKLEKNSKIQKNFENLKKIQKFEKFQKFEKISKIRKIFENSKKFKNTKRLRSKTLKNAKQTRKNEKLAFLKIVLSSKQWRLDNCAVECHWKNPPLWIHNNNSILLFYVSVSAPKGLNCVNGVVPFLGKKPVKYNQRVENLGQK